MTTLPGFGNGPLLSQWFSGLIDAGVIREFYVDRLDVVRRFDDPFWGQKTDTWETEWQASWVPAP